ncbi:MAG: DUF2779 domain-containing protein [Candidatus Margulisiibacteriota bacterium]|nr:DUF2779 domain-containing protein [Candidatus Margulisiibacteriota bacterium]
MTIKLTKTDYILYRDCPKNVWYKKHRPEIYKLVKLSDFEKALMESGIEVELVARKLFPNGVLIDSSNTKGQEETQEYLKQKKDVLFQPVFCKDGYLAAIDILKYEPETGVYSVYEVKSKSSVDEKVYYHDLAFQVDLLRRFGLKINKSYIIHLNSEYVRAGKLDIVQLFKIVDVSDEVESLSGDIASEMAKALEYLSQDSEPAGFCSCVYKGRSKHCSTFKHANPEIPEYSVHDITRIGNSKKKLKELIDNKVFLLDNIPAHMKLSENQQNQVDAYVHNKVIIDKKMIAEELGKLIFPLYFLDYETFNPAIPRFDGFSPYNQIPFQYSVHVLETIDSEPKHYDFLHIVTDDPSNLFAKSLQTHIGAKGSIVVWYKSFECTRNKEIAKRIPEHSDFFRSLNDRVYDLMDIFSKQYYIHKGFKGSASIKQVLPVLVPTLSYKELTIQAGTEAGIAWNNINAGLLDDNEKTKAISDLKKYCGLDTFAMYSIWLVLSKLR